MNGTAALSADGLSCGYSGASRPVLEGLSLAADPGRFICVIGPNGVGKSTLVRTLAGLLPALAGTVKIGEHPLEELAPARRAREVSVVLTRMPSTGYLTVRDFVEIGRHPYTGPLGRMSGGDHRAVDDAIAQVDIAALGPRWLNAISDGERQRAAIARALAQAATLMILDEPTAFLDVEARAMVMTTLRDVAHRSGRTVIATSHDVELVLRIADEIWMLTPDHEILTGAPEDLVLAGGIDAVFPNHVLRFDLDTGSFRLPHPDGAVVAVCGSGPEAAWTVRALERIGMRVINEERSNAFSATPPSVSGNLAVVCRSAGTNFAGVGGPPKAWLLREGDEEREFGSISDLVAHLARWGHTPSPGR